MCVEGGGDPRRRSSIDRWKEGGREEACLLLGRACVGRTGGSNDQSHKWLCPCACTKHTKARGILSLGPAVHASNGVEGFFRPRTLASSIVACLLPCTTGPAAAFSVMCPLPPPSS